MDHWQRETHRAYQWERRRERIVEATFAAWVLIMYAVGIGILAGIAIFVARLVSGL